MPFGFNADYSYPLYYKIIHFMRRLNTRFFPFCAVPYQWMWRVVMWPVAGGNNYPVRWHLSVKNAFIA